ncbi:unnamed protein product [Orchesella dallaii]|uniref:Uncharacterized protein n=1 Tax=Orchesella dallaii TaxID=48710 RepID=A0ABP1S2W9_9HEXA
MEESQMRPVFGGGEGQGRGRGKLMFTKKQHESNVSGSETAAHPLSELSSLSHVATYAAFYEESVTNENEASPCRSEAEIEIAESRTTNKGVLSNNNSVDGMSSSFGDSDSTFSEEQSSIQLPASRGLDGEQETRAPQLSMSRVELAHEFRMDAVLSTSPIPAFYHCCVCGCPAGYNTYSCEIKGHPTCDLCITELKISECPYLREGSGGRIKVCKSQVYQFPSMFRTFIFDQTQVRCIHYSKGCKAVGVWEAIKEHQEECKFAD